MLHQDPSDPTGVRTDSPTKDGSCLVSARRRKADAALALRTEGTSWDAIARTLGYASPRSALVAVERQLASTLTVEDREHGRALMTRRLDRLLNAVWAKAADPHDPEQLAAVGRVREIISDIVKLNGYAAPTEVVVHSPSASELAAWVAAVARGSVPDVIEADIISEEEAPDALALGAP
jgi:hypothetical protein